MSMLSMKPMMITGEQAEDGSWLLRGIPNAYSYAEVYELRVRLFAWHGRSMYGTLLRQGTGANERSLQLSPFEMLEYMATPAISLHLPVEWSEELLLCKR